jgi:flavin-dependent dehydrogenase
MGTTEVDVVIVGGGPAGSTAAAILSEKGHQVLVVEKSRFPRYKVGESLLPYCFFTLERIGVLDKIKEQGYQKKWSAQFVTHDGTLSQPFQFGNHLDHAASQTWQVDRNTFDKVLLDNAAEKGAQIWEETTARTALIEEKKVVGIRVERADGSAHEIRAKITLDASGREGFFMNQNRWRIPEEQLGRFALWSYFEGASHDPKLDDGATTTASLPGDGWIWYIPLSGERVGVGVVSQSENLFAHSKNPQEAFSAQLPRNPWIWNRLEHASQIGAVHATHDYSYRSKYCACDGLVLTGDAFSFIDPVFSSGVFLALAGAEGAAQAIDKALQNGENSAIHFEEYGEWLRGGIENMRALVYAFYDPNFHFGKIIRKKPETHYEITDCLIGNIFRSFDDFLIDLAEFATLPPALPHGGVKEGAP